MNKYVILFLVIVLFLSFPSHFPSTHLIKPLPRPPGVTPVPDKEDGPGGRSTAIRRCESYKRVGQPTGGRTGLVWQGSHRPHRPYRSDTGQIGRFGRVTTGCKPSLL
ncbi:hypothetical protein J6590_012427 [Homalodisca vitripennis]|nr:hypothetical protein J6590_012427 [Homalodisca vitripennis]